jgi:hypothetical protein
MNKQDAEEYTQSLGQILGGSWRQIAWAQKQGIPQLLGLTTEEWVKQRLGGYIRLSIEERREAVLELVNGEGYTQQETADILGVSQQTYSATWPRWAWTSCRGMTAALGFPRRRLDGVELGG